MYDVRRISPVKAEYPLTRRFFKLSDAGWDKLAVVGKLRLRPISFRSGTSKLDDNGREQVTLIVNNIRHYPNFRILVAGHSGSRGDQRANMELSLTRARAVRNDLQNNYNIDPNRIRVRGMGSNDPLPGKSGESNREYNNRLKRAEILFISGN